MPYHSAFEEEEAHEEDKEMYDEHEKAKAFLKTLKN